MNRDEFFMQRCFLKLKISFSDLANFCAADWSRPKWLKRNKGPEHILLAASKHNSFRGSASEVLAVLPFIRYFANCIIKEAGSMDAEVKSLEALCASVFILQKMKRKPIVSDCLCDCLKAKQAEHLKQFAVAYPGECATETPLCSALAQPSQA